MVLITRDPVKAIGSQVFRAFRNRLFPAVHRKDIHRRILREVDSYVGLVHLFRSDSKRVKLHLEFEKLVDRNEQYGYIRSFVQDLGGNWNLTQSQLAALMELSKKSQESRPAGQSSLLGEIEEQVSDLLQYRDIAALLPASGYESMNVDQAG